TTVHTIPIFFSPFVMHIMILLSQETMDDLIRLDNKTKRYGHSNISRAKKKWGEPCILWISRPYLSKEPRPVG
ncbi:MAG: hypothetical protein ACE144_21455, partial [Thermodesulfobacteriota bacterium]